MIIKIQKNIVDNAPSKVLSSKEKMFISSMLDVGTLKFYMVLNAPSMVLDDDSKTRVCKFLDSITPKTPKMGAFSKKMVENLLEIGVYEVS